MRLHAIRYETPTIRSFELRPLGELELPAYTPGAHIDLSLPDGVSRSYSLISSTADLSHYTIAVNRDPKSRGGSAYLCDQARVGDILSVAPPRNNFVLSEHEGESVLFAGGIGITPIFSMISRLDALGRPWRLHYAARSSAMAAFREKFDRLEALRGGRVHYHFDDLNGGVPMDIAARLADIDATAHLYCCGPTPMLDAFKAAAAGRPEDNIHVEHFSGTAGAPTGAFKVVLKRSKTEFDIKPGQTIMQVMLDAGMRVNRSCMEGVCGTCETRVLEGTVDHKDNVLSPREQASNKVMMICCSGAKTDRLVLDL